MKGLTRANEARFPQAQRQAGERIFKLNRLQILRFDDAAVEALVMGGERPNLSFIGGSIRPDCNCKGFRYDGIDCAHLWALLLEIERTSELDAGWQREVREVLRRVEAPPKVKPSELSFRILVDLGPLGDLEVMVYEQKKNKSGRLGKPKLVRLRPGWGPDDGWLRNRRPEQRQALGTLAVLLKKTWNQASASAEVPSGMAPLVLPLLARAGKLFIRDPKADPAPAPVRFDEGPAWRLQLNLNDTGGELELSGSLVRDEETLLLEDSIAFFSSGLVIFEDRILMADFPGQLAWVEALEHGPIQIPKDDLDEVVKTLGESVSLPPLDVHVEGLQIHTGAPTPRARFGKPSRGRVPVEVDFLYGELAISSEDPSPQVASEDGKSWLRRDLSAEARWLSSGIAPVLNVRVGDFEQSVADLNEAGWVVEADGRAVRAGGVASFRLSTKTDWLELEGDATIGQQSVSIPELLAAVRKKDTMVRLGDGSFGILPSDWLNRLEPISRLELEDGEDGALRARPSQGLIIEALLGAMGEVDLDEETTRIRERLNRAKDPRPRSAPKSFKGELRPYQKDGLGWLEFLDEVGLGGCLADDMGLGKTIQLLAHLQVVKDRTRRKKDRRPSLVVCPTSLVENWIAEAGRFTPTLSVLGYIGQQRSRDRSRIAAHDLVVTTYGTVRQDIVQLRDIPFDTIILDEAQAIKNAKAQVSKACLLLDGRQRFVASGTPVENHLGELFSIFDFLNPGMFGRLARGRGKSSDEVVETITQAVAPLILRRKKEDVLDDLPAKTEQTLMVDLTAEERRRYDELTSHFRASIARQVKSEGLAKSKVVVLQALLRLRQAACHGGLIDAKLIGESSSKLTTLMSNVTEVIAEGHKVLIFSQFTSLLKIVRSKFEEADIVHEYLDGQTRKRKEKVDRFQSDPQCQAFLISLKAGGLGLNLTEADYVFILDPWWNPAAEAQAIDRAHRIGQVNPVFAYRLIARGTIEEKIVKLQESKKKLADAILTADAGLLRRITEEDLEFLLS